MSEAYIIDAIRTPRGKAKKRGALASMHPQELVATLLKELPKRVDMNPEIVEDVILGCVTQVADQGACIARFSVMAAEWPESVPGYTVNRFCGSGLEAVNNALAFTKSGLKDVVIGGGVESMSRVSMGSDVPMADGDMGKAMSAGNDHINELYNLVPQGISADLIATKFNISREDVDKFAETSQEKAKAARENGYFSKSIVPVTLADGKVVSDDEHPNEKMKFAFLSKLPAVFKTIGEKELDAIALKTYPDTDAITHVHTPGNSSGVVDGAALVLCASEEGVKKYNLKPRARIVAVANSGSEPTIMLTGPVQATQNALDKAGLKVEDIDLWEINEAFASVVLYVKEQLKIPDEKINVNGGAIALGHPLGATGAMLLGTVLDELERTNKRYGCITLCIGGGMGIATIIERVDG